MDWDIVYTTDMNKAMIIKGRLEAEGIPVILNYESFSKITGLSIDGIGEVKILVPPDLSEKARKIIDSVEKEVR